MDRFGIAVWNFSFGTLASRTRDFADMGYTAVSIQTRFLTNTPPDELAEFEQVIEERDLPVTIHSGALMHGNSTGGVHPAVTEVEGILNWHAKTGRVACLTYDCPREENSRRMSPRIAIEGLEPVLKMTAGSGILVGIEDCPIVSEQMAYFSGWMERYPHWGILIDLGHMNRRLRDSDKEWVRADNVDEYLSRIEPEIIEVHVHNNDGTKDQHAPPYAGNANLASSAKVLREKGFDGISTIELVPSWCGMPDEEIIPACRKSLTYWQDLLKGS